MTKKHYDWTDGPAKLEQHSVVKHDLLRTYLAEYFLTLVSSHLQEELRLTIVDGFAGGGLYYHATSGDLMLGSPFICLEATKEADALVNLNRAKKVAFNVDFVFVERDAKAANYLERALREREFGPRFGKDILLLQGDFNTHADRILENIKKKTPRSGRAIFVLDQYGYKQVPMALLARIFEQLPRAEVILTFNVDSFSSYATDKGANSPLEEIGLPNLFHGRSLNDIKNFTYVIDKRLWGGGTRLFVNHDIARYEVKKNGNVLESIVCVLGNRSFFNGARAVAVVSCKSMA
jgi:three-Cys-motif partner protein